MKNFELLTSLLLIILSLSACEKLKDITDFNPPEIISTAPAAETYEVPLTNCVSIEFSEAMMQPQTEEAVSISKASEAAGIESFTWIDSKTLLVTLYDNFILDETYQLTVEKTACDVNGNTMTEDKTVVFYTKGRSYSFSLLSYNPSEYYIGSAESKKKISLLFSEDLLAGQDFSQSVYFSPSIGGLFTATSNQLEFTPFGHYDMNTVYTVRVKKSLLAQGRKPLDKETFFSFYTGSSNSSPALIGITTADRLLLTPQYKYYTNDERLLRTGTNLLFSFSRAMDAPSAESAITITPSIPGYFNWENPSNVRYMISEELVYSNSYRFVIAQSARSLDQVILDNEYRFTFFTAHPDDVLLSITNIRTEAAEVFTPKELTHLSQPPGYATRFFISFQLHHNSPVSLVSLIEGISVSYRSGPAIPNEVRVLDVTYFAAGARAVVAVTNLYSGRHYSLDIEKSIKDLNNNPLQAAASYQFIVD